MEKKTITRVTRINKTIREEIELPCFTHRFIEYEGGCGAKDIWTALYPCSRPFDSTGVEMLNIEHDYSDYPNWTIMMCYNLGYIGDEEEIITKEEFEKQYKIALEHIQSYPIGQEAWNKIRKY